MPHIMASHYGVMCVASLRARKKRWCVSKRWHVKKSARSMICDIILHVYYRYDNIIPSIFICREYHCMPSLPSTSYPSFPSFVVPRRCKCKWDAPPGVSSLGGSATQHDEGGRRPRLSNSTAIADDGATTAMTTSIAAMSESSSSSGGGANN